MLRSSSPIVRNPVLALPAAHALGALPPESREAMRAVLKDLARDAAVRAETSWRQRKGPMALYWRLVSVYARHLSLALR